MTTAGTACSYFYDSDNRLQSVSEPWGVSLTYLYDPDGNVTQVADSLGGLLSSVYDNDSLLLTRTFMESRSGGLVGSLRAALTYNADQDVTSLTRAQSGGGSWQQAGLTTYGYDPAEKITSLSHQDNNGVWFATYGYSYNDPTTGSPDGRLRRETYNGTPVTYTYDVVDQLVSDGTSSYGFDSNGNRNSNGFVATTDNRLQTDGTWTYTYDPEGNLTKKSKGANAETWYYTYDLANHLLSAEQRPMDGGTTILLHDDFKYDVNGQRIEKDVYTTSMVTTRFAYDRGHVWLDLDGSNTPQARRLYLDAVDAVFARVGYAGGTATAAWYLLDREGSVRDLANAVGAAQDHLKYDGFGNVVSETNAAFSDRYKYTGREFDSEIGLQYNRARYYDPKTGRWTSEDPEGFYAGDPNLYRYVKNDPTNATDPTGEWLFADRA